MSIEEAYFTVPVGNDVLKNPCFHQVVPCKYIYDSNGSKPIFPIFFNRFNTNCLKSVYDKYIFWTQNIFMSFIKNNSELDLDLDALVGNIEFMPGYLTVNRMIYDITKRLMDYDERFEIKFIFSQDVNLNEWMIEKFFLRAHIYKRETYGMSIDDYISYSGHKNNEKPIIGKGLEDLIVKNILDVDSVIYFGSALECGRAMLNELKSDSNHRLIKLGSY